MSKKHSALLICLGNICRSPIAEGVFAHLVKQNGDEAEWHVDSAAIGGWHVGKSPDWRAQDVLKAHNIPYNNTARQLVKEDFYNFDYIFGMDEENMSDLKRKAPKDAKAKLLLLGDFDPEGDRIIRDPYYDSDSKGFEKCYQQCVRSCTEFLKRHQNKEI
ncbi:low molecular weight phosphotyrosine protein phosphatase 1-like [Chrysoperla carnea]|uniref:low molecular weight phosphotyrosine protein phosphatase 1-like n=1 Tax=Chrysoperla carnea TaxID=189513 RepID=UPI001D05E473|nr:low molecular weight phosphotyrosine protein phosphatase 1-like [Chrysoperla carnea]